MMRIQADPGGMESATFSGLNAQISAAIAQFAGPVLAAEGAAGDSGLSSAITDLCAALRTADSSAALSLEGMASAVVKAAAHYTQTDNNVQVAATPHFYK